MTLTEAKAKVAETNPQAIWVVTSHFKGAPDSFEIWDFTYSDELRARIGYFDLCTETLNHSDGDIWN